VIGNVINRLMKRRNAGGREMTAAEGYDLWAATYDGQPDNAVLALESRLFSELLERVDVQGKTVLDIGCGTGRHWAEILSRAPAQLVGADVSVEMLRQLRSRYPQAQLFCASGGDLNEVAAESCDLIVSTLALAHMGEAKRALRQWHRILRRGGRVLITDFHADAFHAGLRRTFVNSGETIEIEHHATELVDLVKSAGECGFEVVDCAESAIDESVRHLFERDRALEKYESCRGLLLVFGICLTRP
jgi:ubiquinone/menaquinone biosynthesis C-methylase UbiE